MRQAGETKAAAAMRLDRRLARQMGIVHETLG